MRAVQNLPAWYPIVVGGVFGAIFASFSMVVVERVPRRESLNGRSKCVCGRQLRAWENIPILGWLRTGGRARCCSAVIPARLVVAECAGAGVLAVAASYSMPVLLGVVALWIIALTTNAARAARRAGSREDQTTDRGDIDA